jgi:serine/threonine protein kinase
MSSNRTAKGGTSRIRLMADEDGLMQHKQLGEGGYGQVFLASLDNEEGNGCTKIALKRVCHSSAVPAAALREIALMSSATADSDRCIGCLAVHARADWIAMELSDGGDMEGFLKNHPPHTVNQEVKIDFMKQAMAGLADLHSKGVIHRDLKPANILCTYTTHQQEGTELTLLLGQVKLADFGLSRSFSEDVPHKMGGKTPTGTLNYRAPELWMKADTIGAGVDGKPSCDLLYLINHSPTIIPQL